MDVKAGSYRKLAVSCVVLCYDACLLPVTVEGEYCTVGYRSICHVQTFQDDCTLAQRTHHQSSLLVQHQFLYLQCLIFMVVSL